ncbi:hypothetical protein [Umezawaea sp. Da 62-37]|uniref:hypothetical protein n=1 Tax=Umezawaea sp. Da 62-37 TaxID=3075927 RepID=UPI0028F6F503|nr:hypothetical protein [Umezawaea sp. Da 62-37]WNV88360.1 hypothetical protein RM788_08710 [Umezawaea sp. Da 62-37]
MRAKGVDDLAERLNFPPPDARSGVRRCCYARSTQPCGQQEASTVDEHTARGPLRARG